ncbi:hypothetical protein HJB78_00930 [Rhizobium lentis]|uniref:hypothetical protein n=1 Tax=Rhizobium lentis TaxID=1138194 RepID=UPI001C83A123|nr:hypothetical protein [Rhizobium lentis]MBX5149569.1 hypothetical protein [Rhizobium lentis]
MKLAEDIFINLAGEAVELRPSLRHALRLERREGSFRQLLLDLQEDSLTAALDIIEPHTDLVFLEHRVMSELARIKPALVDYVLACSGMDEERKEEPRQAKSGGETAKPQAFADYLLDLYRKGTGWLDWTPEQTLDATPKEISLAFEGRIEMLRAVHGGGQSEQPKDDRPLGEKFKSIFSARGTVKENE